jgi:hypothetical protein
MKIIAFSLWGYDPKYCVGAIKNAELAERIYPDWICRYYYGSNTDQTTINTLSKYSNVELVPMNEQGNWIGMFWRFMAADSDDIVISRDTDSRLSLREKSAVDEWLNSKYDFHIMRDHPYHGTEILGGMWGARNGILKGITKKIQDYDKGNFWQVDQNFLREKIYLIVKDSSCVHDEYFEKKYFPTKRNCKEFVGKAFNSDDTEFCPEHGDLL